MYHILEVRNRKYIYFPFSQAFFTYTEELEKVLKGEVGLNNSIKNVLSKEEKIEKYINNSIENYSLQKHTIRACEINTIHACNMNCKYCFAAGEITEKQVECQKKIWLKQWNSYLIIVFRRI